MRFSGGQRRAVERHSTLRAAIDWSYELLSQPEQVLLARLSVFTGAFDLDAVEAVCAGEPVEGPGVLDLLLPLEELAQPPHPGVLLAGGPFVLLVAPVRRDPLLRDEVHVPRADLDFDGYAVHSHQHRVQRLVAIGLGNGDVVLELAGHRRVEVVDGAQHPVAGIH